jgi:hypothetical protein
MIIVAYSVSFATTYYVDPNGNNAYDGRYPDYQRGTNGPFKTIAKGVQTMSAGDNLYLRKGTYFEAVYIRKSGTVNRPITIAGYKGEKATIDGRHELPAVQWGVLFGVEGDHIIIRDLCVINSAWMGIVLSGDHNQAVNLWVEGNNEQAILVTGAYNLIDSCDVHSNCLHNKNGAKAAGGWACALCIAQGGKYSTIQNCRSWNNWGEGISIWSGRKISDFNTVQDCTSYNNWSNNIYLQNTQHSIVQRNLIYVTENNPVNNDSQQCIEVGDEYDSHKNSDNKIINNFVMGCDKNFSWWHAFPGDGLKNFVIANNTFVNARSGSNFEIQGGGTHTNCMIQNNIFLQEDSLPIADLETTSSITFSHNLWSRHPSFKASGKGDVIAGPELAREGQTSAGLLAPKWFKISFGSPARDKALPLDIVAVDFFRFSRGQKPDIGGHEFLIEQPIEAPLGLRIVSVEENNLYLIHHGVLQKSIWSSPNVIPKREYYNIFVRQDFR